MTPDQIPEEQKITPSLAAMFPRGQCECDGTTHPGCWCLVVHGGPAAVIQRGRHLCTRCMDPVQDFQIMIHPAEDNVITLKNWHEDGLRFIALELSRTPEQCEQAHAAVRKPPSCFRPKPAAKIDEDDMLRSMGIMPEAEEVP